MDSEGEINDILFSYTMGAEGGIYNVDKLGGDNQTPPPEPMIMSPKADDQNHLGYVLRAVVLFSLVIVACFVVFNQSFADGNPFRFISTSFYKLPFHHDDAQNNSSALAGNKELGLEQLLQRAAMPNKTVILSPLNKAWIEKDSIFDLFLESFSGNETVGLIKHLIVVALDQKAFDHCLGLQMQYDLNCYFLKTDGVDFSGGEARFMTADYLKMVWRKIDFLRTVLETGYSFIFTDADIMWLRNPFPHFYPDTDFQVSCDKFRGNPSDMNNAPNTGLMYVKSNNRTIEFFKFWYKSREIYSAKHDQDAFNMFKRDPFIREIGLEIKFLNTAYFGGFCEPSRNLNMVCTMHANCCAGLDNKIHDLRILLDDWRKYLSLSENVRESQPPSWTVPQSCGPNSFWRRTPRKNDGNRRKI